MAKTFKDQENYIRFHDVDEADVPYVTREKIKAMNKHCAAYRHGNNRNYYAESKVDARRSERAKAKADLRRNVMF